MNPKYREMPPTAIFVEIERRASVPEPSGVMTRPEELYLMHTYGAEDISELVTDWFRLKRFNPYSADTRKRQEHARALMRFAIRLKIASIRAHQRRKELYG